MLSIILSSVQFAGNSVLPGTPAPHRWPPPVASPSRIWRARSGGMRRAS